MMVWLEETQQFHSSVHSDISLISLLPLTLPVHTHRHSLIFRPVQCIYLYVFLVLHSVGFGKVNLQPVQTKILNGLWWIRLQDSFVYWEQ